MGSLAFRQTARLRLSRPVASDLDEIARMQQDPLVMATLGGVRSAAEAEAFLLRIQACWESDGFGWWTVRDRETGRFLGWGGLRRVEIAGREEVELGYGLQADAWGRGLATELALESVAVGFTLLAVPSIFSCTLPTNVASRRVMEKAGLAYEGEVLHAGQPHVSYRVRRS